MPLLIAATGIIGTIIGSFLAVVAIRWPEGRAMVFARSSCDHCSKAISPWHLIPLASHIMLRGRCSHCGDRIDPLHWQMEASAAAIAALSFWLLPWQAAIVATILGWQLLLLAVLDFRHYWLPNRLTALLAMSGLALGHMLPSAPPITDRLIGGVAGFLILWIIAWGYKSLRGRDGLGSGDAKMLGAIGCWAGWIALPHILLIAAVCGLFSALFLRLSGQDINSESRLPLGSLLAIAVFPAMLFTAVLKISQRRNPDHIANPIWQWSDQAGP